MPTDLFGVKKIYPDSIKKPMSWHLSSDMDFRLEISGNLLDFSRADDIMTFGSGNDLGRLNVLTTLGYSTTSINQDHAQCAANGFMMSQSDWRNFEATAYINMSSSSTDSDNAFFIRGRGGKHEGIDNCEGFAYLANLYYDGGTLFGKEQLHERIEYTDEVSVMGSVNDIWIGVKFVCYNDLDDNVILELWIDTDNNGNFNRVNYFKDQGGWGTSGERCGGNTADQIGTWGGPVITFGWDGCDSILLKWMSIREIDPYGVANEAGSNVLESISFGGTGRSGSGSAQDTRLKGLNPLNE